MEFWGRIVDMKRLDAEKPSVCISPYHDHTMLTWAEWQTDLRGGVMPQIGDHVKVTSFGGLKIAF